MNKVTYEFDTVPEDEPCVQVGTDDYGKWARIEGNERIQMVRRFLGEEPGGSRLYLKSFPHDFGNYWQVVFSYDEDNDDHVRYCFCIDNGVIVPFMWDDEAKKNLLECGYFDAMDKAVVDRAMRQIKAEYGRLG